MKKKVAIITLNGYYNYGNRLQNFALQEILKELDYEVETIWHNESPTSPQDSKIVGILKKLKIGKVKSKTLNLINKKKIITQKKLRIKEFKEFSKENISETNFSISSNNIPLSLANRYDYFVAGSDQIWNPYYQYYATVEPAIEYLSFAPKEKRLSYAASFGISEIPEIYQERVKNGLQGMKSILVREQAGAEIVMQLTGREAHVVLDPTMLLTKEKWLTIAKEYEHKPKKPYLLTYFLGEKSKEVQNYIRKVAKEYNLEIVHLEDLNHEKYYKADPGHFVDFINSAALLCTDSFHGVVFSILMETPFVVFKREGSGPSMYSRIDTLLENFDLENRAIDKLEATKILENTDNRIQTVLKEKKEHSLKILKATFE